MPTWMQLTLIAVLAVAFVLVGPVQRLWREHRARRQVRDDVWLAVRDKLTDTEV